MPYLVCITLTLRGICRCRRNAEGIAQLAATPADRAIARFAHAAFWFQQSDRTRR